jgi:hypothetical protein
MVRPLGFGQRLSRTRPAQPPPLAGFNKSSPTQDVANRTGRRNWTRKTPLPQYHPYLLRTPPRMLQPLKKDPILPLRSRAMRTMNGPATPLSHPIQTLLSITPNPLIPRLAADSIQTTQLRDRTLSPRHIQHKSNPFLHRQHLLPHHGPPPWRLLSCYLCTRSIALPVYPVQTPLPAHPR